MVNYNYMSGQPTRWGVGVSSRSLSMEFYMGSPAPFFNGRKYMGFTGVKKHPISGVISSFITGRGPPCLPP